MTHIKSFNIFHKNIFTYHHISEEDSIMHFPQLPQLNRSHSLHCFRTEKYKDDQSILLGKEHSLPHSGPSQPSGQDKPETNDMSSPEVKQNTVHFTESTPEAHAEPKTIDSAALKIARQLYEIMPARYRTKSMFGSKRCQDFIKNNSDIWHQLDDKQRIQTGYALDTDKAFNYVNNDPERWAKLSDKQMDATTTALKLGNPLLERIVKDDISALDKLPHEIKTLPKKRWGDLSAEAMLKYVEYFQKHPDTPVR